LIRIAVHFILELFQQGRGEGAFAGEEEGLVFFGKQVVEAGAVKAQGHFFRRERAFKDFKEAHAFGLQGDFNELTARKGFEDPLEGRAGNMRGVGEVVVARRTFALTSAQVPESQINGLFGGSQVGQNSRNERGEFHRLPVSSGGGKVLSLSNRISAYAMKPTTFSRTKWKEEARFPSLLFIFLRKTRRFFSVLGK
jgi:hypothetical protein